MIAKISGSVRHALSSSAEHLKAVFASYLIRFRLRPDSMSNPTYVFYYVQSPMYRDSSKTSGAELPSKTLMPSARQFSVPVPLIEEQRRIVARIKQCIQRVEEIEKLRAEGIDEANSLVKCNTMKFNESIATCGYVEIGKWLIDTRNGWSEKQPKPPRAQLEAFNSKRGKCIEFQRIQVMRINRGCVRLSS